MGSLVRLMVGIACHLSKAWAVICAVRLRSCFLSGHGAMVHAAYDSDLSYIKYRPMRHQPILPSMLFSYIQMIFWATSISSKVAVDVVLSGSLIRLAPVSILP